MNPIYLITISLRSAETLAHFGTMFPPETILFRTHEYPEAESLLMAVGEAISSKSTLKIGGEWFKEGKTIEEKRSIEGAEIVAFNLSIRYED